MRTNDQGRIPIPAQAGLALAFLRLDADVLARAAVVADESSTLPLGVDRVRILWVDL